MRDEIPSFGVYTGDLKFSFLDSEKRVVTLNEWLHKERNTVILFDEFRILHLDKMLGDVCLRLGAQKARAGNRQRWNMHCAIGVYCHLCGGRSILSRCMHGCRSEHKNKREDIAQVGAK